MGRLFISNDTLIKFIRKVICKTLSTIAKYRQLLFVVQNSDDRKLLIDYAISSPQDIITQCSVGIDTKKFSALPLPDGKIIFALIARMLTDKGVNEFIEAAKLLYPQKLNAEFWLVGSPDPQNAASIDESLLKEHHKKDYIKYLGYQTDIEKIWKQAHVAVLPSYREGLSRSLLEAGAYGRAVITSDAPGGRELIKDQINGILVPIKDSDNLAESMKILTINTDFREKLSKSIRQHVLENYDSKILAKKMIEMINYKNSTP